MKSLPLRLLGVALVLSVVSGTTRPRAASPAIIGDPLEQHTMLTASDGSELDRFGASVAVDGDTAIVGAPFRGDGAAYVFVQTGTGWMQQAVLTINTGMSGAEFGTSVALDGDTAVVGAPGDSGAGPRWGAAYVFARSNGVWSQQGKLTPADAGSNAFSGVSVAIDGDTVLIGAPGATVDGEAFAGAGYVFVRTVGAWSEHTTLTASAPSAGDAFGASVALDGDTALVGAPDHDVLRGAAHVFVRTTGTWTRQAELTPSDNPPLGQFGFSVALDADTALIGAPTRSDVGAAYVFTRTGPVWTEQAVLTTADLTPFAELGRSVALDGDVALVGTPSEDVAVIAGVRQRAGAVYGFVRSGGDSNWPHQITLLRTDVESFEGFGASVALDGHTAFVGAPFRDVLQVVNQGAAFVFADAPPVLPAVEGMVVLEDSAVPPIHLTITDDDPIDGLTLTVTSSNPSLVPPDRILVDGVGSEWTVTLLPLANQSGTTWITLTATNGMATTVEVFPLFVVEVNDPPAMTLIPHQITTEDAATTAIPFTIADLDVGDTYTLIATSSNPAVVPADRIVFSGTGATRTVTVTPAPNQTGTSTITLFLSDDGATASTTFDVTVTPVNDAPTIAAPLDWTTNEDASPLALAFTVGDIDTPVTALVVEAISSNPSLVPAANVVVEGSGAIRVARIAPVADANGTSTITLTVSDGGLSASASFVLTVVARNDAPTLSAIADQTTTDGEPLPSIPITVTDRETPPEALVVLTQSSNPALVSPDGLVVGGTGTARTLTVHPIAGQTGTTTITVFVGDGVAMASAAFTLTVEPAAASTTYLLAEGATGPFFDLDVLLANPHAAAVPVTLTFLPETGLPRIEQRTLAPQSRTTLRVDAIPGLAHAAVSTLVTAPAHLPIVVERTMGWDASGYGAHTEKATAGAAPEWFFAEGAQGFFSTYVLLVNPHDAPNTAHVTWFREGEPALVRAYPLPPHARVTVDAGAEPALVDRAFGAHVRFERPGAAERAMYFGPGFAGGHASAGVPAPARRWFLAEGATGAFFMTFLLLANPQAVDATVTLTYLTDTGIPVVRTHTVPAAQRRTINIALEDAALASAAVATDVASTVPIVVERTQYWPQPRWTEAHNSFGETATAVRWGLAEGGVGGPHARQSFLLLANPGSEAATVTITFLRTTGAPVIKTVVVPPASRFTIAITGLDGDVPELADEDFGAVLDATQPIAVERALYSNANGVVWAAGTNATGTRLP